jgi:hypothetical protein
MTARTPLLLMLAASIVFSLAAQAATTTPVTGTPTTMPPATVAPDGKPTPATAQFDGMDGNNDGSISSSEHEVAARKIFDLMDSNSDDELSTEEIDAAQGKIPAYAAGAFGWNSAQKIRALDINADGAVSQGEYADSATKKFQLLDANSDGSLTRQEYDVGG